MVEPPVAPKEDDGTPARTFRRLAEYLLRPTEGAALAVFRLAFGLTIFFETIKYFAAGWVYKYFILPQFYFSYLPFLQPLPGLTMVIVFIVMAAASLSLAAGFRYRAAAATLCALLFYTFLIDKTNYLNHMYLICLISFLLAIMPAHHAISLDAIEFGPRPVPLWSYAILRFQIVLVFFFAGLNKLNSDWLAGYPQGGWLAERAGLPLIGPLCAHPFATTFVTYAGILIDLSAGFLLLCRPTLPLGVLILTAFLLTNGYLFQIGAFPYLMIASLSLFARPDWPLRLAGRTPAREQADCLPPRAGPADMAMLVFLGAYAVVQVLLPLRHWLYPGNVDWTEAGHRFAWRMMLREKRVRLAMYAVDPSSGKRTQIELMHFLTPRQAKIMASKPDMLVQFARYYADREERKTGIRPRVEVTAAASLNGRPEQAFIRPGVDLASAPEGRMPAEWICPLKDRPRR